MKTYARRTLRKALKISDGWKSEAKLFVSAKCELKLVARMTIRVAIGIFDF